MSIRGVLPTGRSIGGLEKKQKPWINRGQGVGKFVTFDEFLRQEVKREEM
ncbi:hypothetical protein NPIL_485511, partial [Nephila pilipes]